MKRKYLYLASLGVAFLLLPVVTYCQIPLASTPTRKKSYVSVQTPQVSKMSTDAQLSEGTVQQVQEQVTYVDGLGRPIQLIHTKGSRSYADVVQPVWYDPYGKESKKYLSYSAADQPAAYKTKAIKSSTGTYVGSDQFQFYQHGGDVATDLAPFSQTVMEASPLDRAAKQGAVGNAWQPDQYADDHTIRYNYTSNNADEVFLWILVGDQFQLGEKQFYDPNELFLTETKDENWRSTDGNSGTVKEYKDKQGRVVLRRIYTNNQMHDTYYVYDDSGNLRYVLPPEASERLRALFMIR